MSECSATRLFTSESVTRGHPDKVADQIVVMEAGRVVDAGTHEELLGRSPLYRTLYQTQVGRS